MAKVLIIYLLSWLDGYENCIKSFIFWLQSLLNKDFLLYTNPCAASAAWPPPISWVLGPTGGEMGWCPWGCTWQPLGNGRLGVFEAGGVCAPIVENDRRPLPLPLWVIERWWCPWAVGPSEWAVGKNGPLGPRNDGTCGQWEPMGTHGNEDP